MAANPMLEAVLRFQNHQTTTPQEPIEVPPPVTTLPVRRAPVEELEPQPRESYQPGAPDELRKEKS